MELNYLASYRYMTIYFLQQAHHYNKQMVVQVALQ